MLLESKYWSLLLKVSESSILRFSWITSLWRKPDLVEMTRRNRFPEKNYENFHLGESRNNSSWKINCGVLLWSWGKWTMRIVGLNPDFDQRFYLFLVQIYWNLCLFVWINGEIKSKLVSEAENIVSSRVGNFGQKLNLIAALPDWKESYCLGNIQNWRFRSVMEHTVTKPATCNEFDLQPMAE